MSNAIFVATDLVGEDNAVRDITAKRSTPFVLVVCSFLSYDKLMSVIYKWQYLNNSLRAAVCNVWIFLGVRETFPKIWNSLGNFCIWWKNWTTSVISSKTTKTAARSCPFANPKLPTLFSKAPMQSRVECKEREKYDPCSTLEDVKHKVQMEKSWQLADSDTTNDFTFLMLQQSSNSGALLRNV